ncbi:MAG: tetratricopeptide repeat protein, partial [Bacteroidota bacterium]
VSLFPSSSRLWGINHLHFLPLEYLVAMGLCAALVLFLNDTTLQFLGERCAGWLWPRETPRRNITHLTLSLVSVLLFWLFRSGTLLLGDGRILLNDVAVVRGDSDIGELILLALQTRTPLSTFLYFLAAQIGKFGIGVEAKEMFQGLACIAGGIYVYAALRFVGWKMESWPARLLGVGLLLMNGATMLLFGYVEYYSLFFVSTFLYCVSAVRAMDSGKSAVLPFFFLVVTVALHGAGLLLLPSFLYVLLKNHGSEPLRRWLRPRFVLAGVGASFLVAGGVWLLTGEYELRGNFLPVVSLDVRNAYTLLAPEHLADYGNALLLLSGVGLIILLLSWFAVRPLFIPKEPVVIFLFLVALYQQVFVFGANTDIGFARDWDVMLSMGGGVVLLLAALLPGIIDRGGVDGTSLARVALAVAFSWFPWIALNANEESSARRFEALLNLDRPFVGDYRTAYGYEVLALHWRERGNTGREQTFLGKAIEESDNIRFHENVIISLNGSDEPADPVLLTRVARRFHNEVLAERADTSSPQFQDHLSMYYVALRMMREAGLCSDALPMYREAIDVALPNDGYALLGIAQCTAELGKRDEAAQLYKEVRTSALDIVGRDWQYMGGVFLDAKEFVRAISAFEQAIAKGNGTETAYFGLFRALLGMGEKEKALLVETAYQRLYPAGRFHGVMRSQLHGH